MNRKISLWLVLLLLWFSFVITIIFGWAVWHIDNNGFRDGVGRNNKITNLVIFIASIPHLVSESFKEIVQPRTQIRPNLYPGVRGFKMQKNYVDSNYLLVSTYDRREDQSIVKLIRLSDQKTIHQWKPDFNEIKKIIEKDGTFLSNVNKHDARIFHPLLSSDGSIIFNYYLSPLIKINKDSKNCLGYQRNFSSLARV